MGLTNPWCHTCEETYQVLCILHATQNGTSNYQWNHIIIMGHMCKSLWSLLWHHHTPAFPLLLCLRYRTGLIAIATCSAVWIRLLYIVLTYNVASFPGLLTPAFVACSTSASPRAMYHLPESVAHAICIPNYTANHVCYYIYISTPWIFCTPFWNAWNAIIMRRSRSMLRHCACAMRL